DTPVSQLSIAQQQMVEIAGAVSHNAKVVIMDEPTSSLTAKEIDELFEAGVAAGPGAGGATEFRA
ncbi:MAG TPA: ATP-binding cassette domain-containing protein, partial [Solirubrobacterales bacterium]|nr:ATP-binding cassette domain-containing protein [Solirubrobacterales bacterium]